MKYDYARAGTDDQTTALQLAADRMEARPAVPQPARPDNDAGRPPRPWREIPFATDAIDTATPTSRAMWQMIGVLAEIERSLISERKRAGVKAARRRSVKFGRKVKVTPEQIDRAR